jgi:hypothetical protein
VKKTIMPIRLGNPRKTSEDERGGEEGEKMDWKPKGSNRPTDHELEVAIFEAP